MSLDKLGSHDTKHGRAETKVVDDEVAELLGHLLNEMRLLSTRFEEAFNTKLNMEDISDEN